jgi:hypothetical protein
MAVNETTGTKIQGHKLKYIKDKSIKHEIFY